MRLGWLASGAAVLLMASCASGPTGTWPGGGCNPIVVTGTAVVKVVDANGQPVPAARVEALYAQYEPPPSPMPSPGASASPMPVSQLSCVAAPGTESATADAQGVATVQVRRIGKWRFRVVDTAPDASVVQDIGEGKTVNVTLTLRPASPAPGATPSAQ